MLRNVLCAIGLSVLLGGCSTSYKLNAPVANLATAGVVGEDARAQLERELTEEDIARLLDAKVQAKLPSPVAVARLTAPPCRNYTHLEAIDPEELDAWKEAVVDGEQITAVRAVSPLTVGGTEPKLINLRKAAAEMGCELLLVYVEASNSVTNYNDAAVLYWTIIGLWVVPGSEMQYQTVMQAALIDARTGVILGTATGGHKDDRLYPVAFEGNRRGELARVVPKKALESLMKRSAHMVGRVTRATKQNDG